jgi:molybdenum storage protein
VSEPDRKDLTFYDRISAKALLEMDLDDLIIERPILTLLQRAKCLKQLQIIDAIRHPDHILAALEGQHVGTIIHQE